MSSGLYEIITTGLTVKDFAYVPLVGVNPVRLTGADLVMKFILDYTLTFVGLILISPSPAGHRHPDQAGIARPGDPPPACDGDERQPV